MFKTFLIALFLGMFLGYAAKDLLTVDSKIIYHIKRIRAKSGGIIDVITSANTSKEKGKEKKEGLFKRMKTRREERRNKKEE